MRKESPADDRISKLIARKDEIEKKIQKIKLSENKVRRARETRLKILVGHVFLENAKNNRSKLAELEKIVFEGMTRDNDKKLIKTEFERLFSGLLRSPLKQHSQH